MATRIGVPSAAALPAMILMLLANGCSPEGVAPSDGGAPNGRPGGAVTSAGVTPKGAPAGPSAGAPASTAAAAQPGGQDKGYPQGGADPGYGYKDKYDADYMKGRTLTDKQKLGRDTWIMWTGGNQAFFKLAREKAGQFGIPVDYYRLLDSRGRSTRFTRFGLVNEPNCRAATKPDQYGLWLDEWLGDDSYPDTKVYGEPTGVVGLRKFKNPKFDASKWDVNGYFRRPGDYEPPYLIGMSCCLCHMGFNPLRPPADPNEPKWENMAANLGNQFIDEGALFFGEGKIIFGGENGGQGLREDDFLYQYARTQPRGTSETSRLSYDFINNPNVINSIFFLHNRPAFNRPPFDGPGYKETLNPAARQQLTRLGDPDGFTIHHVLKDGADSQSIPIASVRVYVNIGMCGSYWIGQLWNPFQPDRPQQPFDMEKAAADFPEWNQTLDRMPALEDYLATYVPMHLEDAEGGKWKGQEVIPDAYKSGSDEQREKWKQVERGQEIFAENCAFCHSSKMPADGDDLKALLTLKDYYRSVQKNEDDAVKQARARVVAYYRKAVKADDFLQNNTLTDDVRYPVSELKTSAARAIATNADAGHIWEQFSSPEYKSLPSAGELTFYNPVTDADDRKWTPPPAGGYYRTASLVSIWATAPYLHNNSVGTFTGDPSVPGRLKSFDDGIRKLLHIVPRDGHQSIKRTTTRSYLTLRMSVLGSVANQKIMSLRDELLAKLPDPLKNSRPQLFDVIEIKDLKDAKLDALDKIAIRIPVPAGTPINLLANLKISDPEVRLKGALAYLGYVFQTDLAAKARELGIVGRPIAAIADREAKRHMDELLKLGEHPDLVEDHGHDYGTGLSEDDKSALIEYLKKL
jgi:hypothetical protein